MNPNTMKRDRKQCSGQELQKGLTVTDCRALGCYPVFRRKLRQTGAYPGTTFKQYRLQIIKLKDNPEKRKILKQAILRHIPNERGEPGRITGLTLKEGMGL